MRLNLPEGYAPFAEGGFGTPSGKCELYSERLGRQGLDPLPTYIPPHEDPQTRHARPGLEGRADALVAVGRRQADVDDADVGPLGHRDPQEVARVADRRDNFESVVGEQAGQAVAKQREVLDDHRPHGIAASISVGPPGGLVTVSAPSKAPSGKPIVSSQVISPSARRSSGGIAPAPVERSRQSCSCWVRSV